MTKFSVPFLMAAAIVALAGCSDNTASTATTAATTPVAGVISLGTSANWIPTDNSTSATLTATLVDSSNAVMSGVAVSFAATSGNLTASSATTDANGQAIVALKSGLANFSNRTATVTATVAGQSASVPILIKGSIVALALTPSNTVQVGAGTLAATATATNAAGLGLSNMTIRFSIGATSTGSATLSAVTLTTDATGVTPTLTITPTAAGTVVLTAEWLDSAGAVTATATKDIIVTGVSALPFAITTPAANPFALSSGLPTPLAVTVPATIAGTAVASVRISATSGTWVGTNPVTGPLTSILQTPSAGAVAATYTAPANSGSVTVQVDALDGADVILSSLTRTFVISATAASAAKIILNASASTISPSSGSNISTLTLEAVVRDASSNTVGGAPVMFGLLGTTGSGETVSPAVVYTNSQGLAATTFSAGSSPTLAAIYAQARVVGQVCTFSPNPLVAETNNLCAKTPLIVSSSAVSVTVGFGTAITDTANSTQYMLPGSVMVVNSNGSPVAGVTVTLTAFPAKYRNGSIYPVGFWTGSTWQIDCGGPFVATSGGGLVTSFTDNEDVNRNGILDDGTLAPAEDTQALMTASQSAALAIPNNGLISPGAAAGGAIPMTVTTDSNGAATFYIQYPKSSAWFIEDEVTARVIVSGTESMAKVNYILPMSLTDAADDNCTIGRTASY